MTNFDPPAKPKDEIAPLDGLSSPFDRFVAWLRRARMDRAAKRRALLTECGKTLTPDQRALKVGFGIVFEVLTLLLGLIFLWFNAIFFFLQNERVEISVVKPSAAMWFTEKFSGQAADLDTIEVQYRKDARALALVARGVEIKGKDGETLLNLPKLDSQFGLSDLIFGRFIPRETTIEGGAVTMLVEDGGGVQFGLGTPESFEDLGADFKIDRTRAGGGAAYDWKAIDKVALKDVNVYVIAEPNFVRHHFAGVTGNYAYDDSILKGAFTAVLESDESVPVQLEFDSDDSFELVHLNLSVQGFNPGKLHAQNGAFPRMSGLNAPVDADIRVTLGPERVLKDLGVTVTAKAGTWGKGETPAPFQAAELRAIYDADRNRIDIQSAGLSSDRLTFSGTGNISAADPQTPLGVNSPFALKLDLSGIDGDPGPAFEDRFTAKTASLDARIDPVFREAVINAFEFDVGHFTGRFSGDVAGLAQDGPFKFKALNISGSAQGALTQKDVLKYWPVTLSGAARNWVKRSILQADVSRLDIQANLTQESFGRGHLLDEELSMSFPVANTTVKYISTMTPMTQSVGSGILRGNSFSIGVDTAKLGDGIDVFDSRVDIERFTPIGADLKVTVNASGSMTPLLSLIDQPPFGYATRFGLPPDEFTGTGKVNYIFTRPVGMPDRPDLITHTVSADFTDVSTPVSVGPHKVQNGQLHLDVDADGLRLFGPVNVGPWPAQFSVLDSFDDGSGNADYRLSGTMTRDDFDRLGIGFREYFSGDVRVAIDAKGDGLSVEQAAISADLRDADLRFDNIWTKPAGQDGRMSAMISKNDLGGVQISDLSLLASGLDVQGNARFGPDFRLLSLNFPVTKLDGFIDSAIVASTPAAGELAMTLRGNYLNLEPWVAAALSAQGQQAGVPVGLSGTLSTVKIRNELVLNEAVLGLQNAEAGLKSLSLDAQQNGKPLTVSLTGSDTGGRTLAMQVPDAGRALAELFDFETVKSGSLLIDASLPPPGAPGPVTGTAKMTDFKLVDAPVFARMLSLGSLTGLGEVLSGDGMNFDRLYAPFEYEEKQISVKDARASGPAIGITATGRVDFDGKTMDVDGVLVPAYTFNSVLGNIPLLGDIMVGKEGEGIFALNYSVDGSFSKTQIAVNPLSAFAPGFLRRVFDAPVTETPAKSAPQNSETQR